MPLRSPPSLAVAVALAVSPLSFASLAHAEGTKQACVNASTEGQALRDANKLRAAREHFVTCARDECPGIVRKYCIEWLADMDRRMPTVIFRALTGEGGDVSSAQVSIDGVLQTRPLGTAVPLDPGEHAVHVEHEGALPIDEHVVVVDGQKERVVVLQFPKKIAPAPSESVVATTEPAAGSRITPLTIVAGSIGVLGIAGFTILGLDARSDLNHLRQTCAPFCASSDLDSAKHKALFADLSLGIGVVGLGVAAYSFFAHHDAPARDQALVDVRPLPGGAFAQVGARF